MKEDVEQLKKEVAELKNQIKTITDKNVLLGTVNELLVERVIKSDITTGTPPAPTVTGEYPDNNLLYQQALTGAVQDIKILNFPEKVLIYNWKGQRLAIPVYDATTIVYP